MNTENLYETWMRQALTLAEKAAAHQEVPVGALIIKNNQVISSGYNLRETQKSPLGHAEIMAISEASQKLGSWRLNDCTLVVTLEPCLMCAGALVQSRISKVIFGAYDAKGGALVSLYRLGQDPKLNHRFEVIGGVLEKECGSTLSDFFKNRRKGSHD